MDIGRGRIWEGKGLNAKITNALSQSTRRRQDIRYATGKQTFYKSILCHTIMW